MVFDMVTRDEWGALPPKQQEPLRCLVEYVGWSFTVTDTCDNKEECIKTIKFLQKCHMEKKKTDDIKHNFLIASDGTIYEGRGWLQNTLRTNPRHEEIVGTFITIARIGMDFAEFPPTPIEIEARDKIIRYGIENNYIKPEYEITEAFQWLEI